MNRIFNEKYECMNKRDKFDLQSERLRDVVQRVYCNVPWYRRKMEDVGIKPDDIKDINDIVKLPFTEKKDLRENYPFGSFALPNKNIVRVHASSGTSGKLTVVGYTKHDLANWAECCARGLYGVGVDEESIIHIAYGYGLFTGGLGIHYGGEYLGAMVVPVSSGNTPRQIMLLEDFKADTICCTPSYAIFLSEEAKKIGKDPRQFALKYGFFGAEPWTEEMRNKIEKAYLIKAYDIYGLSEITGPGVATECFYQCGSHVQDDMFYPEIINPESGLQLSYGEEGELVFTTLLKEGMPLIRYRTRDVGSITDEICKCGRTSVRLRKITGRYDDMIIVKGVNVFPSQIETALLNCDERVTSNFRVVLDRVNNLDIMDIEIELATGVAFDEVREIEKLTAKVASTVASEIGVTCNIKLISSGKLLTKEGEKIKRVLDNRNNK
ncbi:MAG: phenylacetate--CoA ligase [Clostridiales bacterium]|jgi:phenylacetate-CoA ligase|nr:phenylacetate--CoA ligase [Clostridiales bacterium]